MKSLSTIILGVVIGLAIMYFYSDKVKEMLALPEHKTEVASNVLLEKIRNVYKVIVVEGEFADIINYSQNYHGIDLPGFRKKALVKVTAKVSVGYDMDRLKIDVNNASRIINIQNLPDPEILAVDPEISYYDLDEGLFNSFTEKELTKINRIAKDSIYANAKRSTMMESARAQASRMFEVITLMAQESGWRVVHGETPAPVATTDKPTLGKLDSQGNRTVKRQPLTAPQGSRTLPKLGGAATTTVGKNSLTAPNTAKPKATATAPAKAGKPQLNTRSKSASTAKTRTTAKPAGATSNTVRKSSGTTKGGATARSTVKTTPNQIGNKNKTTVRRKPVPKNKSKSFHHHETKK